MTNNNLQTSSFMDLISGVTGGEFEYVDSLPINDCYPDLDQPRYKNLSEEGVSDITATFTVTKGRIWHPIVVQEADSSGHKILMGGRRWLAVKLYGSTGIPALIVKKDIDSALYLQLMENIARKPLDIREEGRSYVTLKEQGKTQKEIAASLGKSEAVITEAIMMWEMESDHKLDFLNNLYESGECQDASTLAVLVRFARVNPESCKRMVELAIKNGTLNRKWAKSLVKKDFELSFEEHLEALNERINFERGSTPKNETSSTSKNETNSDDNADIDKFKLEQEQDGISKEEQVSKLEQEQGGIPKEEQVSKSKDSKDSNQSFKDKKVTTINVMHDEKVASLIMNRIDAEGFGWIKYHHETDEFVRVDLTELSIIFVG